jgi:hypothetical protein
VIGQVRIVLHGLQREGQIVATSIGAQPNQRLKLAAPRLFVVVFYL